MKGARPLTVAEVDDLVVSFGGRYHLRDRALFVTGLKTGFRISELLSLQVRDVRRHGRVVDRVTVRRRHMKRRREGRTVRLHPDAAAALAVWIAVLEGETGSVQPTTPVFRSRKGVDRSISRQHAWRILNTVYLDNELEGQLGTHAMRKTFAARVHELLGRDLMKTQKALGHQAVTSTVSYLSFAEEEIDDAVLNV